MASRILLADDSITIQKVVNLTFADEGIEVIAVSNGDLAERRLAEIGPDLVLADIFMPGKNGYELCEAIKENSQFRNVPVVLLVGAFEPFDQAEARRVKADAHLTKPFESRTLVETVRRLIAASWRSTTGPIAMPTAPGQHGQPLDDSASADSDETQFVSAFEPTALMDSVMPSAPDVRCTGELGSPPPEVHNDVFELGLGDTPLTSVSATLTDTNERFEPLELSTNGDFSPAAVEPSFALDASEGRSDSESQSHEIQEPHHIVSLQDSLPFENVQPSALHEVNISGAGEDEHWISAGSYETSRLDRPSEDGAWRGSNGSAQNYPVPEFTAHADAPNGAPEAAAETAVATLLAVDEPLGDVLFGETAVMGSLPVEVSAGDAFGLELGEPDVAEAALAMPTHFDLVEIVEAAEVDAPAAETPAVEMATAEATMAQPPTTESPAAELTYVAEPPAAELTYVAEPPAAELTYVAEPPAAEPSTSEHTSAVSDQPAAESFTPEPVAVEAPVGEFTPVVEQVTAVVEHHETVKPVEPVPEPQLTAVVNTLESTEAVLHSEPESVSAETMSTADPMASDETSYSIVETEPVVMPVETAEQAVQSGGNNESAQEASFTAPATWVEEQAQFAAIDGEPAPIEVQSTDSPLSTVSEPQSTSVEQTDAASAASQNAEAPAAPPADATVSPAVIEEIVRRVVAEMSQSVVREVAWEVVPDAVERVIDQLTRESLTKRA